MSQVQLAVRGHEQFRDLSKRLKTAGEGKKLQRRMRAGIRAAARPAEQDLRAAVTRAQVTSTRGGTAAPDRSTELRARIARAVRTSLTQRGIRVIVDANKVDPKYGASLPRYLDGSLPRYRAWRHPVFGSDAWVEQSSGSAWFFSTMERRAPTFLRAVLDAMDETERDLTS